MSNGVVLQEPWARVEFGETEQWFQAYIEAELEFDSGFESYSFVVEKEVLGFAVEYILVAAVRGVGYVV
jgi:hypothetical protein